MVPWVTWMLDVRKGDGVARLILDRPNVRNALSRELVRLLGETLEQLDADPHVAVIVLEGSPPGFCAGSDLKELSRLSVSEMRAHEAQAGAYARRIALLTTPVIAAVEGFAIGGGFILAASCDLIVTARSAKWHLPEASIGWIPPWGLHALVARVGLAAARRLAWGIEPIVGVEAYRQGIADYLAADGEAAACAMQIAQGIAAMPAHSLASVKRAFGARILNGAEALDAETNRMFAADCAHERAQITLASFREKTE